MLLTQVLRTSEIKQKQKICLVSQLCFDASLHYLRYEFVAYLKTSVAGAQVSK